MAAPVIMQHKFQQSKVHQFIDSLVVLVVSETGTHSAFSKTVETPLVQFLDWLMPVVQRQVQMAQTVQIIVELPQVQLLRSCGRLCAWHLVPQIMEEIVKVNSFYELEQIVASCHRSWRKS